MASFVTPRMEIITRTLLDFRRTAQAGAGPGRGRERCGALAPFGGSNGNIGVATQETQTAGGPRYVGMPRCIFFMETLFSFRGADLVPCLLVLDTACGFSRFEFDMSSGNCIRGGGRYLHSEKN